MPQFAATMPDLADNSRANGFGAAPVKKIEPIPPAFIGIIAVTVSMLFKVGPAPVVDKATGVAKAII